MTLQLKRRFLAAAAVPAMAALGLGVSAASASAATTTPAYGHHQECDETLVYRDSGAYDPYGDLVVVRDVCHVRIQEYGHGYGKDNEVVSYDQEHHGYLRFHIVFGVSDAHVFGGEGY